MPEPKPWRKPLRERQANAVAMETWPQMDDYTRKKVEAITRGGVDGVNGEDKPASTLDINVFSAPKTDLKVRSIIYLCTKTWVHHSSV